MSEPLYLRLPTSDFNARTFTIRRNSDGFYWRGGSTFSAGAEPTASSTNIMGSGFLSNVYSRDISTSGFTSDSYVVNIYASGTNIFLGTSSFTI